MPPLSSPLSLSLFPFVLARSRHSRDSSLRPIQELIRETFESSKLSKPRSTRSPCLPDLAWAPGTSPLTLVTVPSATAATSPSPTPPALPRSPSTPPATPAPSPPSPWDDGVLYLQTLDVSYNSSAGSVPDSLVRLINLDRPFLN